MRKGRGSFLSKVFCGGGGSVVMGVGGGNYTILEMGLHEMINQWCDRYGMILNPVEARLHK